MVLNDGCFLGITKLKINIWIIRIKADKTIHMHTSVIFFFFFFFHLHFFTSTLIASNRQILKLICSMFINGSNSIEISVIQCNLIECLSA